MKKLIAAVICASLVFAPLASFAACKCKCKHKKHAHHKTMEKKDDANKMTTGADQAAQPATK